MASRRYERRDLTLQCCCRRVKLSEVGCRRRTLLLSLGREFSIENAGALAATFYLSSNELTQCGTRHKIREIGRAQFFECWCSVSRIDSAVLRRLQQPKLARLLCRSAERHRNLRCSCQ
jgi:hypothetical protein